MAEWLSCWDNVRKKHIQVTRALSKKRNAGHVQKCFEHIFCNTVQYITVLHYKSTMAPIIVLHKTLGCNIESFFRGEQDMCKVNTVHYIIGVLYVPPEVVKIVVGNKLDKVKSSPLLSSPSYFPADR